MVVFKRRVWLPLANTGQPWGSPGHGGPRAELGQKETHVRRKPAAWSPCPCWPTWTEGREVPGHSAMTPWLLIILEGKVALLKIASSFWWVQWHGLWAEFSVLFCVCMVWFYFPNTVECLQCCYTAWWMSSTMPPNSPLLQVGGLSLSPVLSFLICRLGWLSQSCVRINCRKHMYHEAWHILSTPKMWPRITW